MIWLTVNKLFSAQARAELAESQAIVQECLEEKRAAAAGAQGTTEERKQLGNQQAVVVKFEDETQDDQFRLRARLRLKRRDADIRNKTLELRKLQADAANASPGYGSGYSSPDCGYSPPFSPPLPGTAHVHPRGPGGAAKPCLSLYLSKDVRVDVSANGSLMLSNPRQGVFISLGSDGRQMAVVHPVGRVMQNKGRIEIQTQDWAMKSAKMWQRGISFTTNQHGLSYPVDTAGARSTFDTFRNLHSRNIAQGEEL